MDALIFETTSFYNFGPFWSAILSGFATVDMWGNFYLTPAGAAYLARRGLKEVR